MATNKRRVRQLTGSAYRTPYSLPKVQRRFKRYVTIIGSVCIIILIIYGVFFSGFFAVKTITVHGNTATSTEQIKKLTNEALNSTFAGKNILFISGSVVTQSLKQSSLQFEKLIVNKNLWHRSISVTVVERQPAVLWQSNTSIYVLADDGRAIEQVGTNRPEALPVIRDEVNLPVKLGGEVVSAEFIQFVRALVAQLPSSQLMIKELSVPGATTSELYVKVEQGYTIKFDTSRMVGEQISDLKAALATLKQQNHQPSQYIDLRVAHRVFYQ